MGNHLKSKFSKDLLGSVHVECHISDISSVLGAFCNCCHDLDIVTPLHPLDTDMLVITPHDTCTCEIIR